MKKGNHDMRRLVVSVVWLFALLLGFDAWSQEAKDLLGEAALAYENSNGLKAKFTINNFSAAQNIGESFEGTIQMRGDKFVLMTPDVYTWFDGQTQWTYVVRTEEVNVTKPSGDDLKMTNPMLLLNDYDKGFIPEYKGESTAANGKSVYDIELKPKVKSDIVRIELRIEKFKKYPASIEVEMKNGTRTRIQVEAIEVGLNQPDPYFTFPKGDYPDAEIIDLR